MRLFIATAFPEEVLHALNARVTPIKTKVPPATWVRPQTQHLTFAFLGDQDESLIDRLAPMVEQELAGVGRFEGTLHGCGFLVPAGQTRPEASSTHWPIFGNSLGVRKLWQSMAILRGFWSKLHPH